MTKIIIDAGMFHQNDANVSWNWFSVNDKKLSFDRKINYLLFFDEKCIIVKFVQKDEKQPADSGVFCYDVNGELLWEAEKPLYHNGEVAVPSYYSYIGQGKSTKNGIIVLGHKGTPDTETLPGNDVTHRFDWYEGVFYAVDVKTGKLLYVRDNSKMFNREKDEWFSFAENKIVSLKEKGIEWDTYA